MVTLNRNQYFGTKIQKQINHEISFSFDIKRQPMHQSLRMDPQNIFQLSYVKLRVGQSWSKCPFQGRFACLLILKNTNFFVILIWGKLGKNFHMDLNKYTLQLLQKIKVDWRLLANLVFVKKTKIYFVSSLQRM